MLTASEAAPPVRSRRARHSTRVTPALRLAALSASQLPVSADADRVEVLSVDGLYLHSLRGDKRDAVMHLPDITCSAIDWYLSRPSMTASIITV